MKIILGLVLLISTITFGQHTTPTFTSEADKLLTAEANFAAEADRLDIHTQADWDTKATPLLISYLTQGKAVNLDQFGDVNTNFVNYEAVKTGLPIGGVVGCMGAAYTAYYNCFKVGAPGFNDMACKEDLEHALANCR